MRFLRKDHDDISAHSELSYDKQSDRVKARDKLIAIQLGFCAYSERYLMPLDSVEIEHFDPRLKGTEEDNISNWHAVLRWMNAHKPKKIEPFLPLPDFQDWDHSRLEYLNGKYQCDGDDIETTNLINFLGLNRPEPTEERRRHVARISSTLKMLGDIAPEEILKLQDLSFPTALEAELGIPAMDLISNLNSSTN